MQEFLADASKPLHALCHIVKLPAVQLITMSCGRRWLMDDRLSGGKGTAGCEVRRHANEQLRTQGAFPAPGVGE